MQSSTYEVWALSIKVKLLEFLESLLNDRVVFEKDFAACGKWSCVMVVIVNESAFEELLDFGLETVPSMADLHCEDWGDDNDGWKAYDSEKNSEGPLIESHAFGGVTGNYGEDLGG
jgi:hypothetical protein